jgi:hypothetical protein
MPSAPSEPDPASAPVPERTAADDLAAAVDLANLMAASFAMLADVLPTLPVEHATAAIASLEQTAFPTRDPVARARLALLVCVDVVAHERRMGTGLGEILDRHFPNRGDGRDRQLLEDRASSAFRMFATDWLNWLYSGPPADLRRHLTIAIAPVIVTAIAQRTLRGPGVQRPVTAPWSALPEQAAFAVAATYSVGHPRPATKILNALEKVGSAVDMWETGRKGRWESASAAVGAAGLRMQAESLRAQWNEHVSDREATAIDVCLVMP